MGWKQPEGEEGEGSQDGIAKEYQAYARHDVTNEHLSSRWSLVGYPSLKSFSPGVSPVPCGPGTVPPPLSPGGFSGLQLLQTPLSPVALGD